MKTPVDRMTSWGLVDHLKAVAEKFTVQTCARFNGQECVSFDEMDLDEREALLNLLGAIEDAEYALRVRAKSVEGLQAKATRLEQPRARKRITRQWQS